MRRVLIFLAVLFITCSLFADQAAWITKEQAESGAKLIKGSGMIRHYCAPCGESAYRAEKVSSAVAVIVESNYTDTEYYEVQVNGTGVDLAYVYVRKSGKWVNAAMLLGIDVSDVPEFLPDSLPGVRE